MNTSKVLKETSRIIAMTINVLIAVKAIVNSFQRSEKP